MRNGDEMKEGYSEDRERWRGRQAVITDWSLETVAVVGGRLVELAISAGKKVGLQKGPEECGGGAVYRNITTRSPR